MLQLIQNSPWQILRKDGHFIRLYRIVIILGVSQYCCAFLLFACPFKVCQPHRRLMGEMNSLLMDDKKGSLSITLFAQEESYKIIPTEMDTTLVYSSYSKWSSLIKLPKCGCSYLLSSFLAISNSGCRWKLLLGHRDLRALAQIQCLVFLSDSRVQMFWRDLDILPKRE